MKNLILFICMLCALEIQAQTKTWNGSVSTDWSTAANWTLSGGATAGAPTVNDNVVIPNTTNKPSISAGTAAVARTVEMYTNSVLNIATTATLTLNGAKVVNGNATAFDSYGTVNNNGKIIVPSSVTANFGLINKYILNNNAGAEIIIDNTPASSGTTGGFFNRDFNSSSGVVNNSGKISIGTNSSTGTVGFNNVSSGTVTNNAGGEINISRTTIIGFRQSGSGGVYNSGKINVVGSSQGTGFDISRVFENLSGGEINIDGISGSAFSLGLEITNNGKINIGLNTPITGDGIVLNNNLTNAASGEIIINNTSSLGVDFRIGTTINNAGLISIGAGAANNNIDGIFNNLNCGRFLVSNGDLNIKDVASVVNQGYFYAVGVINNLGSFTNNGVLKYGSVVGTIINAENPSIIVNDNASSSSIFTYGTASYNGTIDGIFTNPNATLSAGTFTAPNTFSPASNLPSGSQTLYAKITATVGGTCSYVVPFIYTYTPTAPVFTLQPQNSYTCQAAATSFKVSATNVNTYQWQVSTNGGSSFTNLTNTGVYSNVNTNTLNISNVTGLGGNQYRCVATGLLGSTNSATATLQVNQPNVALQSPTDDINTIAETKQAVQTITATNKILSEGNVIYKAGSSIRLNPGFEANSGSVFLSQIASCN